MGWRFDLNIVPISTYQYLKLLIGGSLCTPNEIYEEIVLCEKMSSSILGCCLIAEATRQGAKQTEQTWSAAKRSRREKRVVRASLFPVAITPRTKTELLCHKKLIFRRLEL